MFSDPTCPHDLIFSGLKPYLLITAMKSCVYEHTHTHTVLCSKKIHVRMQNVVLTPSGIILKSNTFRETGMSM